MNLRDLTNRHTITDSQLRSLCPLEDFRKWRFELIKERQIVPLARKGTYLMLSNLYDEVYSTGFDRLNCKNTAFHLR